MSSIDHEPRDFPLRSPSPIHPPHEFAYLHANEPVSLIRHPSGQIGYLVVRYDDVKTVLSDYRRFSRAAAAVSDAPRCGVSPIQPGTLLSHDPPTHSRLRQVLSRHFSKKAVAIHERRLSDLARTLLNALFDQETGDEDLVSRFTRPFGTLAIMEMMGIPAQFYEEICHWSDRAMALPSSASVDVEAQAFSYLRDMFRSLFADEDVPLEPGGVMSTIAEAASCGSISEFEKLQMAVTVLVAGHETTVAALGKAIYRLILDQDLLDQFRCSADSVGLFLQELLRTSSGGSGHFVRIATQEVLLSGVSIPAGCPVTAPPSAANVDPAVFPGPSHFDIGRGARDPLTFGAGPHRCLGEHLALLQLRVALTEFVSLEPAGLRLAHRSALVEWHSNRPLDEIRVSWGSRG